MTTVVIADTSQGLKEALDEVFSPFGGVQQALPIPDGTLYVKPNGVHFSPYTYTDPIVLEAVLAYLRDHGYTRLAVMESSTGGNFTRLVFQVTGYARICRRYRAEPVYLDEGRTIQVDLCDGTRARISRRLHDEIVNRGSNPSTSPSTGPSTGSGRGSGCNLYLSLPKLKTHSMATVTLGVKNQQAFPVDADRMERHCHRTLHRRLAALYDLTQPDFCIVEGLTATAHGHFPPTALLDECLVEMNVLIGGRDTLAVDVVGARVLGYNLHEIEHLRLCAEWGLGESDLSRIQVRVSETGEHPATQKAASTSTWVSRYTQRLPHTILRRFHPGVRWVVGRKRACVEGCRGNSECIQEMLYNDYYPSTGPSTDPSTGPSTGSGRSDTGGWTLVCGSGFEEADLDDLPGDILVVGQCACQEVGETLAQRYLDRRIYRVDAHNDLMSNTRYQARLMGVTPVKMVPLNPLRSAFTLLRARLHNLKARVPPLLG